MLLTNAINKVVKRTAQQQRVAFSQLSITEAEAGLPELSPGTLGPSAAATVEQLSNGVNASSDNGGHVSSMSIQ